jgi:hypothetical protein
LQVDGPNNHDATADAKGNGGSMAKLQTPTKGQETQLGGGVASPPSAATMPLNFKVPSDFRREFKTYAAQHNKKLNQLLYEAFAALKAKND